MKKGDKKIILTTFFIFLSVFCFFKNTPVKADSLTVSYNMNVELNADNRTLAGKEAVLVQNTSGSDLSELVFHLYPNLYNKRETMPFPSNLKNTPLTEDEKGYISIESASIDGKDVQFTQDNQILKIVLQKNLKKNDNVTVCLKFNLKIPQGKSRLSYSNDVYSLANWYPVLSIYDCKENKWDESEFYPIGESNYSDVAEYNVNIKVPKDFVVVSTGKEKETSQILSSKTVNLNAKNTRDFVIMISPNFKCISKELNDGIKINSYYLSSDDKALVDIAESVLDTSANALKFFNEKFGKYPYDEFDIVESYYEGGAMEYPQLIQMPKYVTSIEIPSLKKSIDAKPSIIQGAVHELCHQWWYVTVGNNEFKEPLLDEAFATFFTAYYFEKAEGKYSANAVALSIRYNFFKMAEANPKLLQLPCIGSGVDKFGTDKSSYVQDIYVRGPLILEDLREKVGEDNFLKIMQTYFRKYKFQNASIEGFLDIIGQQEGTKVKDYIRSDIYSDNYNPETLKLSDKEIQNIKDQALKKSKQ